MTQETGHEMSINWFVSDQIKTQYANNVVIQHSKNEFVFSFFEILPPMLLGSPQEVQSQLQQMRTAHAECVARIVLTPESAENFARALQQNLANYQTRFGKNE